MAVLLGGGAGVRIAYNQADDNAADRLLALQAQVGRAVTMVGDVGVILQRRIGFELIDIDVGLNIFDDGQTYGEDPGPPVHRTLTSASAPFMSTMLGLQMTIFGHGLRYIEKVVSATEIWYSGPAIAAATGLRFTQPLGLASFDDGHVDGNVLTSVSGPFVPELVGRNVSIHELGTFAIATYTSPTEIVFKGSGPLIDGVRFTVPVFMTEEDRLLLAGAQIIDAHRSPPLNTPTTMRWRLGDRSRRGGQRVVV
jgi:hypothetical protein